MAIALASVRDQVDYHLGSMAYSCVQPAESPMQRVHLWRRACAGLGAVPLVMIHDLGMLFAYSPAEYRIEPFAALPSEFDVSAWRDLVVEASRHPTVARVRGWGVSDRTVGTLVARTLRGVAERFRPLVDDRGAEGGDEAVERAMPDAAISVPAVLRALRSGSVLPATDLFSASVLVEVRKGLAERRVQEVQFVELFGGGGAGEVDVQSLVDLVDFAGLSGTLEAVLADLMCLAPSILGTGKWKNEQHYPIAGVSGIAQRGSLDSVVPSEYALPAPVFFDRLYNGGLLYFGRERPRERPRDLLWLVVNTGFSMAGDPEILSRVLGIALAKKMALKGCEFAYSTFDETLSPVMPLASAADYRYFLGYRSERPTKERPVLEALCHALRRLRRTHDRITVLLLTHLHFGDCDDRHSGLFEEMKRDARLTAILVGSDVEIERSAASHARSWRDLSHFLDRRNVLSYSCLRDARRRREEERRIVLEL